MASIGMILQEQGSQIATVLVILIFLVFFRSDLRAHKTPSSEKKMSKIDHGRK